MHRVQHENLRFRDCIVNWICRASDYVMILILKKVWNSIKITQCKRNTCYHSVIILYLDFI